MKRYWFKPKRHGIGAVPSSWQGWALAAAAVLAILLEMQLIPPHYADAQTGRTVSLLAQALTAAAFLTLCRVKTEGGWRWRWGRKG